MSNPEPFASDEDGENRRRPGAFAVWLLCAVPWLVTVGGLSIYDHHKSIRRAAESYLERAEAADSSLSAGIGHALAFASHWLSAAIRYSGEAIGYYGILPAGITFVLFVLFLPWAIRWAGEGSLED
jgi:hypothetical protein